MKVRPIAKRMLVIVAGAAVLGLGLVIAFTRGAPSAQPDQITPTVRRSEPSHAPVTAAPRSPTLPLLPAPAPSAPKATIPPAFRDLLGSPQIDPRAPDYEPVAAYELMGGGNVRNLFLSEPRADPWASEREADLVSLVLPEWQAVDPDARVEAECRTATCRIRLFSQTSLAERLGQYPLLCLAQKTAVMTGTAVPVSPDAEEPVPSWFIVFRRETLPRDGFLSWIGDMCPRDRDEWRQRALR